MSQSDTKITIRNYDESRIKYAAQIIVKNRLFVNGWIMRDICRDILTDFKGGYESDQISIAYDGETPIGAMIHRHLDYCDTVDTFVRVKYRGQGIGRRLVNEAKHATGKYHQPNRTLRAYEGAKGSIKFYEKCDVFCQ